MCLRSEAIMQAVSALSAHLQALHALATSIDDLGQQHEAKRLQKVSLQAVMTERTAANRLRGLQHQARKGIVEWDVWMVAGALALAGRLQVQVACLPADAIDAAVLATQATHGTPYRSGFPSNARALVLVLAEAPRQTAQAAV